MSFTRASLLRAASMTWFSIGLFLMTRGIDLIVPDVDSSTIPQATQKNMSPLFNWACSFTGITSVEISLFFILLGLVLGMIKARTIFKNAVMKNVERILQLPEKTSLIQAFAKKDYIIMASMMLFGFLLRSLGVYDDLRGLILVAVGAGLIQGALLYIQARHISLKDM